MKSCEPLQMIGMSPAFVAMQEQLRQAAPRSEPVLLVGERGSGKELAARALHLWSDRCQKHFVPVLMPSLPDSLVADELFGHVKNSFTDAETSRAGKISAAAGGTIFLDEIGDLSHVAQATLLRVLDTGECATIGEDLPRQLNGRFVAATNHDMASLIMQGRFRADLYDRLRVFEIRVPPLRERGDDIRLLAAHFLRHCCVMPDCPASRPVKCLPGEVPNCCLEEFFQGLSRYHWPGNVRELKSLIIRLRATQPRARLDPSTLPIDLLLNQTEGPEQHRDPTLRTAIKQHIQSVLESTNYNQSAAAKQLGLSRASLYDKIKTLGISVPPHRSA